MNEKYAKQSFFSCRWYLLFPIVLTCLPLSAMEYAHWVLNENRLQDPFFSEIHIYLPNVSGRSRQSEFEKWQPDLFVAYKNLLNQYIVGRINKEEVAPLEPALIVLKKIHKDKDIYSIKMSQATYLTCDLFPFIEKKKPGYLGISSDEYAAVVMFMAGLEEIDDEYDRIEGKIEKTIYEKAEKIAQIHVLRSFFLEYNVKKSKIIRELSILKLIDKGDNNTEKNIVLYENKYD